MNGSEDLPERLTDQCADAGPLPALADRIENILVRRILTSRLEGYTLEVAKEIVRAMGFVGDGNADHLTALGSFTRSTYERTGRNADPVELFEAGMFWAIKHHVAAERIRADKAEEDLSVINRAAAHCQGRFGGRMSEVDRIFQEITRVSAMYKTRAALAGRQTPTE